MWNSDIMIEIGIQKKTMLPYNFYAQSVQTENANRKKYLKNN